MKKNDKIRVGISCGDINGIGLEVILKTFEDTRMFDFCTPVIFCNTKIVSIHRKSIEIDAVTIQGIKSLDRVVSGKLNVVNVIKETTSVELGKETKEGGEAAFISLSEATKALKNELIDVLVTAPINKNNIQSEAFAFEGHTEYLESQFDGNSLMILMTDEIKIGLITGHIPVSKVSQAITPELITKKVGIMHESLLKDFGISKPKIAVLGLNPHCGDHGVIGNEDDEIIRPTLETIQKQGKIVYGPYAADSFFGSGAYKNFDGVLAMYHDQGLGPFKTLSFGSGVNFTAGLDIVRTSPDHGTAYEITGKDQANHSSFREAVFTAIKIVETRNQYIEMSKNKLKPKEVAKSKF